VREINWIPRQVQPVPNRMRVTLTWTMNGYISSGVASGQYGLALNQLIAPSTNKGGATNNYPNSSSGNFTGALNWLSNATLGTGFYLRYLVWNSRVQACVMPAALADTMLVAFSAITGAVAYASELAAADGPNTVFKMVCVNEDRGSNTLSMQVNHKKLFGEELAAYRMDAFGTSSAAPAHLDFLQMNWGSSTATNLANNCPYSVRIESDVEFFLRGDTLLEDLALSKKTESLVVIDKPKDDDSKSAAPTVSSGFRFF